jgi:hypothetical protein
VVSPVRSRSTMPLLALAVVILVASSAGPAIASDIYKDREITTQRRLYIPRQGTPCGATFTRTNCSPDYVGSEMGLAKPSYYGTRVPDDGVPMPRW